MKTGEINVRPLLLAEENMVNQDCSHNVDKRKSLQKMYGVFQETSWSGGHHVIKKFLCVDKAVSSQVISATLLKRGEGLMNAHSIEWNDTNPVNHKISSKGGWKQKRTPLRLKGLK